MKEKVTPATNHDTTSWKESPYLLIKGFLMGSADIIPGVSGGTMALILGIYSRLIHAIKSVDLNFIKHVFSLNVRSAINVIHWKFLFLLLGGIFTAILFFTRVVPLQVYMFTHPELIYGLFFGLILGSIYILIKEVRNFTLKRHGLFIMAGTIIGFSAVTLVPVDTPDTNLFVFLSGSVAICAMILPGISGSYILLILNKYDYILTQIAAIGGVDTFAASLTLGAFGLGAIVGLALFSRLLSWLLDHYYNFTLAVLVGFLIGSLYAIWPYQHREYREIVTRVQIIEYNDPRAVELRDHPPDQNQPRFHKLGKVINENASFDQLKKVELLTVSQKLIQSNPFIPYITEKEPYADKPITLWQGLIGVGAGLILVGGLDYLRTKN